MASIIKIVRLSKQLPIKPTNPCFINSVRTAVMNRDWQPGPYPKTEEERIKAARKYNMHPDEYVPYPDDDPKGFCKGDYPDMPLIGAAAKDPYYPYDIPEQKRNYNETLPEEFDMLGHDKLDFLGTRERFSTLEIYLTFFGMIGVTFGIYILVDDYKHFRPVLAKQFPKSGEKHYTFEPAK
ncbi:NADH dehydrogenase [ubiquinone] 1 beta subcomplex subunit 8, mitochondrial [Belonocnema kinseyi]|uniref:NADH dehydrogenase [ubiquinone] 1 beta subcomplex subunit 8, mitochondrial n=1 Tax=Belonocnema kinseyi TaxID=2817044 RepID=UPI00143CEDD1|nr:NADH dehydrogenase [ubiquinone] 1 beta subcomplex subunit 8, mitochondrial [Belonocnema kinseyi]